MTRTGRIATALMSAESATQQAYRAWLEHAQGCTTAHTADNGCEAGQRLWRTYRDSRDQ